LVIEESWPGGFMNIDHPWFPHVAAGITAAVLVAGAAWIVQVPAPVEEGTEAPAFAGVDLDGSAVSLEDFDDKVILLNIWATWCAPCRREMPSMQRLYDDVSDESFEIVAVSIDGAADQSEVLRRIGEFGEELGLGFTLQVLVTIVQNCVDRADMGVGTSSVAFFRSMGGAFGTAIFGAVLNARLAHYLRDAPAGVVPGNVDEASVAGNVQAIHALPDRARAVVTEAWVDALGDVFLTAIAFLVVALVAALLIPEIPLGTRRPEPQPDKATAHSP
jgi:thiol-disulfide isomerase/thioredoxin